MAVPNLTAYVSNNIVWVVQNLVSVFASQGLDLVL